MNKFSNNVKILIIVIIILFVLNAYMSNNSDSTSENIKSIDENINTEIIQEEFSVTEYDYSEELEYYENLCDEYGYLTYDMVYYPEKWKYYCSSTTKIYHTSWLCNNLNKNNNDILISSSSVDFLENIEGLSMCPICENNPEIYFLDEENNIIHKDKDDLNLGTLDYISSNKHYQIVSYNDALSNNCQICECCNK